jgi:hypothetical protein
VQVRDDDHDNPSTNLLEYLFTTVRRLVSDGTNMPADYQRVPMRLHIHHDEHNIADYVDFQVLDYDHLDDYIHRIEPDIHYIMQSVQYVQFRDVVLYPVHA